MKAPEVCTVTGKVSYALWKKTGHIVVRLRSVSLPALGESWKGVRARGLCQAGRSAHPPGNVMRCISIVLPLFSLSLREFWVAPGPILAPVSAICQQRLCIWLSWVLLSAHATCIVLAYPQAEQQIKAFKSAACLFGHLAACATPLATPSQSYLDILPGSQSPAHAQNMYMGVSNPCI